MFCDTEIVDRYLCVNVEFDEPLAQCIQELDRTWRHFGPKGQVRTD